MKAKINLNSNLPSKMQFYMIFLQKPNFKNFHFNFDEEKKISNGNFSKILFYNPPNFYFIMVFKHQKWKLHEDLTSITSFQTQRQVFKVAAG